MTIDSSPLNKFVLLLILCLGCFIQSIYAEENLLPAEKAFIPSLNVAANNRIQIAWHIEPGYYLYKEKFKLILDNQPYPLDKINFPLGKIVDDALFGEVTIYKNSLDFSIDPAEDVKKISNITLFSQGCYEPLGICYPPQKHEFNVSLIANAQASQNADSLTDNPIQQPSVFLNQGGLFKDKTQREFLPVDDAFKLVTTLTGEENLQIYFEIADDYYLYKPHIKFDSLNKQIKIDSIELPQAVNINDPHFGEIGVYYHSVIIPLNLTNNEDIKQTQLVVAYQGCAVDGICYPPQKRLISLDLTQLKTLISPYDDVEKSENEDDKEKSLLWYLLAAFGGGLLLTFTPCVLPMIPILSGIIVAEQGRGGFSHSGLLSVIYVLGTGLSYALIGAVAGASGEQLQAYFQTPWAIGLISLLLIIMALSMFGLFKLQLPAFMQTNLTTHSDRLAGGGVIAIFAMGFISALIVGACVSPLLISTLSIAIAKGSPLLGAGLMFSMAMGMGVVLIIFGFEFGHLVPKVGNWMVYVNKLIGLLLIVVALYLLSFIPQVPILFLWSAFLIGVAVYWFMKQSDKISFNIRLATNLLAVMAITWGIVALVGALTGSRDILRPISLSTLNTNQTTSSMLSNNFQTITKIKDLDALFVDAKAQQKMVMLDYYATWCLDCLRMDKTTFSSESVINKLNSEFLYAKIDVTKTSDPEIKQLKKRFNVYGPPATLFFNHQGEILADYNFYGYKDAEQFLSVLNKVIEDS